MPHLLKRVLLLLNYPSQAISQSQVRNNTNQVRGAVVPLILLNALYLILIFLLNC